MSEEVRALHKDAQISAQKVRPMADAVRGMPVSRALGILELSPKKSARVIEKVLKSAIANAEQNNGLDVDHLIVSSAYVNEGQTLKRFRPKGMGRMRKRYHRRSHVTIAVRQVS